MSDLTNDGSRIEAELSLMRLRHCMMKIEVMDKAGDYSIGTGFHIGDGYVVTARHVIEQKASFSVTSEWSHAGALQILDTFAYPENVNIDLAVLKTNFDGNMPGEIHYGDVITGHQSYFELCPSYTDWADSFQLVDIVLLGYPPIPRARGAYLVAVKGHVSAVIDRYDGDQVHFIISCTARGGFSGAPCVLANGFSPIGTCTQALVRDEQSVETGFAAVIGNEPLLNLLELHGIDAPGARML